MLGCSSVWAAGHEAGPVGAGRRWLAAGGVGWPCRGRLVGGRLIGGGLVGGEDADGLPGVGDGGQLGRVLAVQLPRARLRRLGELGEGGGFGQRAGGQRGVPDLAGVVVRVAADLGRGQVEGAVRDAGVDVDAAVVVLGLDVARTCGPAAGPCRAAGRRTPCPVPSSSAARRPGRPGMNRPAPISQSASSALWPSACCLASEPKTSEMLSFSAPDWPS